MCAANFNMARGGPRFTPTVQFLDASGNSVTTPSALTPAYKMTGFDFQSGISGVNRRRSLPSTLKSALESLGAVKGLDQDRDEVPMASWTIGGCGARLQAINKYQNRRHGSSFGAKVRPYAVGAGVPVPLYVDFSNFATSGLAADAGTCCSEEFEVRPHLTQITPCRHDHPARNTVLCSHFLIPLLDSLCRLLPLVPVRGEGCQSRLQSIARSQDNDLRVEGDGQQQRRMHWRSVAASNNKRNNTAGAGGGRGWDGQQEAERGAQAVWRRVRVRRLQAY